jgi:HEAT repeat protein
MMRKSVLPTSKSNTTGEKDQTIEGLIMALSSDNGSARREARQSLLAIGSPAVRSLIEALKQKNDNVRREAVKALREIGDPEVPQALIKTLEDEEFDIRWLAAEGVIGLGVSSLKPLLQALIDHGDSPLLLEGAHHVIHYMAKGGLKKYLGPVLTSLEGVEPAVKAPVAAFHALEMLKEAKII